MRGAPPPRRSRSATQRAGGVVSGSRPSTSELAVSCYRTPASSCRVNSSASLPIPQKRTAGEPDPSRHRQVARLATPRLLGRSRPGGRFPGLPLELRRPDLNRRPSGYEPDELPPAPPRSMMLRAAGSGVKASRRCASPLRRCSRCRSGTAWPARNRRRRTRSDPRAAVSVALRHRFGAPARRGGHAPLASCSRGGKPSVVDLRPAPVLAVELLIDARDDGRLEAPADIDLVLVVGIRLLVVAARDPKQTLGHAGLAPVGQGD